FDVDSELIHFINSIFKLFDQNESAKAKLGDVFLFEEFRPSDVCLLLKVLVLFDRQKNDSSLDIMKAIPAKFLVVSFPTKSLGGVDKGMEENYRKMFYGLISGLPWNVSEVIFENELVFVVEK
ncbi:hypothetical protein GF357_00315, partial [Candidatus Dojkabacteria bacterium]|nr:hypothetical protein [Candidatus Dojkabacteria bacterium]